MGDTEQVREATAPGLLNQQFTVTKIFFKSSTVPISGVKVANLSPTKCYFKGKTVWLHTNHPNLGDPCSSSCDMFN